MDLPSLPFSPAHNCSLLQAINRTSEIIECQQSAVDLDRILGLQSFDLGKILDMDPAFLKVCLLGMLCLLCMLSMLGMLGRIRKMFRMCMFCVPHAAVWEGACLPSQRCPPSPFASETRTAPALPFAACCCRWKRSTLTATSTSTSTTITITSTMTASSAQMATM